MNNIVPFTRVDRMMNPQFYRVEEMNSRIKSAGTLSKVVDTHRIASGLLYDIRHDIITLKPHHLRNDAPFLQRAFSAHFDPTMVAKEWRSEINARFNAIKLVSKNLENHEKS
jgi:hypothetical protein